MEVEDVHARVETVDIYTVQLSIADQPVREMEVVQTEQPFVILGRDWLENQYLLMNGPEQTFLLSNTPLIEESWTYPSFKQKEVNRQQQPVGFFAFGAHYVS